MFNGFSGLISFSPLLPTPCFSPFFPSICPTTPLPFLHPFDRQITVTIRFTHTHTNTHMQTSITEDPVCCQPLRIMGHLHHPLLSSVFTLYPSIASALLFTSTTNPSTSCPPPPYTVKLYIYCCPSLFLMIPSIPFIVQFTCHEWQTTRTCAEHVDGDCPPVICNKLPSELRGWQTFIGFNLELYCVCVMLPGWTADAISLVVSMSLSASSHARMHYVVLDAESDFTGSAIKSAKLMESVALWREFNIAFGSSPTPMCI